MEYDNSLGPRKGHFTFHPPWTVQFRTTCPNAVSGWTDWKHQIGCATKAKAEESLDHFNETREARFGFTEYRIKKQQFNRTEGR